MGRVGRDFSSWLYTSIIMFVLYLILVGTVDSLELITGGAISCIIALFTFKFFSKRGIYNLSPRKVFCAFIYFFYLFWQIIVANLDVARRVIDPRLPINPGIVKVKTTMKSDLGKTAVANSITLTPGTFTLDIKGDDMYIHWIDVKTTNLEEASREIPGRFELCFKKFLD